MGAAAESLARGTGGRARLFLDGVGPGVVTDVTSRGARGMTVERSLPFLKVDSEALDDEGRRVRIRDVRVDLHEGTPSLVLDLEYEEEDVEVFGGEDTLPAFALPEGLRDEPRVEVVCGTPTRREATVPWFGAPLVEPGRVTVEPTLIERDSAVTFRIGQAGGPALEVPLGTAIVPVSAVTLPARPRSALGLALRAAAARLSCWLGAAVDLLRGGPKRPRYAV